MTNVIFTKGWDSTEFSVPGKISRIASEYIDSAVLEAARNDIRLNDMSLDIIICGHDAIIKIDGRRPRKNSFEIYVNVKRSFNESVETEGSRLGEGIAEKLKLAINKIVTEYMA